MSDATIDEPRPPAGQESGSAVPDWTPLPDVAEQLGTDVVQVRQMLREHRLVALRRDQVLVVPALLVHDGHIVKGLSGVLTLLADAGYSDEQAVDWLFRADDSLPGRPVDALRQNRGTEVRRRAQALGF